MKKYEVYLYIGSMTYIVDAKDEQEARVKAEKQLDKYLKARGSDAAGDWEISEVVPSTDEEGNKAELVVDSQWREDK